MPETYKSQVIELAQAMIKVNSFESEGKHKLVNFVKDLLEEKTDAKVTLYDMDSVDPYLIAERTCENPKHKVLLSGHLDTVTPEGMKNPFNPIIDNNKMWGRGSADMKSGCAAQLIAFIETAKLKNQSGNVYLVFTTDEEYSSKKIRKALGSGHLPKCDFCIVSEPTSGQLGIAHKGEAWIEVNFIGKSAHSSVPHEGINAIYMANKFISKMEEYGNRAYEELNELPYGKPTIGVGVIHGGTDANVVPHQCSIIIDKRYPPGHTLEMFIEEVEQIIKECENEYSNFKAIALVKGDWPPVMFPMDNEMFAEIKRTIDSTLETPTQTVNLPYWAEGGFIQMFDIPVLYYGPGIIDYAHSPNEKVNIHDIIRVTESIYALLKKFCY